MTEKRNFLVFRVLSYLKYITNQNDLLQVGRSCWSVIKRKKDYLAFQNNK